MRTGAFLNIQLLLAKESRGEGLEHNSQSDSDPPSAVLHHPARPNRRALQYHDDIRDRHDRAYRRDFSHDPFVAGENGAQDQEDSARHRRGALPAGASDQRAYSLARSPAFGLYRLP